MASVVLVDDHKLLRDGIRAIIEGSGEFDLSGSLSVTWNEGIGTPGNQQAFDIMEVPAPGALALLGLGGLAVRRRRA